MSNDTNRVRGLMLVISSPSGAGKTTLTRMLLQVDPNLFLSISATTRPPRDGEVDGVDYHFVSHEAFAAEEAAGAFLESATVFANRYGTPRRPVEDALAAGRSVVFDVDWQGARALRESAPQDVASVFILPPSLQALQQRLEARGKDSAYVISGRMQKATAEISHWDEYDYVLVNQDLNASFTQLQNIMAAERLRRPRQIWLSGLVTQLLER
ncbi:MAG: guanylate kinase [Caulobacterales bacterium]|jgi:guanylate kinase